MNAHRRLGFESLEGRQLLAGNVSVVQAGGGLVITGDDAANVITIESFRDGVVQVRGFSDITGAPTSVNNASNGTRLFFNVNGNIEVYMKGGNDLVRVTNLVIRRSLIVDMGAGVDELITGREGNQPGSRFGDTSSGPLYVQGQFQAKMGTQSDKLFQSDVRILSNSQIDMGSETDTLTFRRPSGSGANVEYFADLTILPGSGSDKVNITGLVSHSLTINDLSGTFNAQMNSMDVYGTLKVISTSGPDRISIQNTNCRGDVIVNTGAGSDVVSFLGKANSFQTSTGDGNDQVTISPSDIDKVIANLGREQDRLDLTGLISDEISVHGDDGDDVFTVRNTRARAGTFFGDKNFDTYREPISPPNQIQDFQLITIERVETF